MKLSEKWFIFTIIIKEPLPSDMDCTFEVDTCGWTQSTTDDFDWTRNKGPTGSSLTGPDSDHTTGRGFYYFTEASTPQSPGDKATLISPTLPSGQDLCLQMYTNMYGASMGSIDVKTKTAGPTGRTHLLTQFPTADTRATWRLRNIYIPAQTSPFTVQITGTIGSTFKSDAAIDDITIKRGKC